MNKHILIVMKWLKDPESVSKEALKINRESAYAVYAVTAATAATAAYAATAATAEYAAAATAAEYAAAYWVDEFFRVSGDSRKDYEDESIADYTLSEWMYGLMESIE